MQVACSVYNHILQAIFNYELLILVMVEIERKFLVTSNAFKLEAFNNYTIKQGFLNSHKERTVR